MPKGVEDLRQVTGLCKELVRAGIMTGELPGYRVGSRYVVPDDAFNAFCRGQWEPKPRPIFAEPVKSVKLIHSLHKEAS